MATRFQFPLSKKDDSLPIAAALEADTTRNRVSPTTGTHGRYGAGYTGGMHKHSRSLSQAIGKMRARSGSVTAHEVVDALKAPVSPKLILLCMIWYMSSAMTNTSSKSILNAFPRPVSLTIIQFAFVSGWCVLLSYSARTWPVVARIVPGLKHGLRPPTREVLATTAPMAVFQVGGHILSSFATSRIPVSLVHTIKGMSPLFTVFAYRYIFGVRYSTATYISLIPLTIGVMLACSAEFRGNFIGILCAFFGAMIFVWQNIFSKKLFNESNSAGAGSKKLDKLNLLCYSSGMAFLLTLPIWLYVEGFGFLWQILTTGAVTIPLSEIKKPEHALSGMALMAEYLFNGTSHFGQNIIAFVLLSMISPVTYSIASLVKRIFVIVMAIIWFGNTTTRVQALGIGLTFFGLYLYDRAGDVAKKERKAKLLAEPNDSILPMSNANSYNFVSSVNNGNGSYKPYVTDTQEKPSYMGPPPQNGVLVSAMETGLGQADYRSNGYHMPGPNQEEAWRPRTTALGA